MSTAQGVVSLYKLFLNRLPESSAAVEFWTGNWGNTITAANVTRFLTAVAAERGAPVTTTLDALYQAVLGRAPDAAGRAHWAGVFGSDIDAADVATFLAAARAEVVANSPAGAAVDNSGNTITLFFNKALTTASNPLPAQFTVENGASTIAVSGVTVINNQVTLRLASALPSGAAPVVSYDGGNTTNALRSEAGTLTAFTDAPVRSALSLAPSLATSFQPFTTLALAGAEITAFDKTSSKLFVTSDQGLQIVRLGSDLRLTLEKVVSLRSVASTDDVTSVATKNGLVAVAVKGFTSTLPGTVVLMDTNGNVLRSLEVGANPDMVTFTPDGRTLLVANEGELGLENLIDAAGSVSLIDLSAGAAAATVRTASFNAFNSQLAALRSEGVRLFNGTPGFENRSVADELEPEFISVSPDGRTAFVTLQEANAIGVLDLATATFTDIVPLGLKNFNGLAIDTSDRDGTGNSASINLQSDQPVFGQYMPDAIVSFVGADGRTYYAIANEGDARPQPDGFDEARVSTLDLDDATFPNEAALKGNGELGRLNVTRHGLGTASGNAISGDTDGDGDIDQLLMYGTRSFSILDSSGRIVFDSGSHIEQFIAANSSFTAFDDGRSDNKGPEPEGITVGVVNGRTLAFVGLERGGGGVMVYDVTDPAKVSFVQYLRNTDDVSPEGLLFIAAADSPTGRDLLVTSNETSNTLTVFQNAPFTLQLLHFADAEAGLLASSTAPKLAALVDKFEDEFANSITLAGGDNFIPSPFLTAGTDVALRSVLGTTSTPAFGAADIQIHNLIGVQASTVGNHEFDKGTSAFADVINASPRSNPNGALFPYLSANLDFSGDSSLSGLFVDTTATAGLEEARSLQRKIAPSAVITVNGEKIGLVGATTQKLEAISSTGGVEVKGFPTGEGSNGEVDDMDLLAAQLQPVINDLTAQGVNKVIVMAHLQVLANERLLATKLSGVDVILAAGSNTRLGDSNDRAAAFVGHEANFADTYPLVINARDGKPTLVVNTDNEFTYLGRLVVDFDSSGNIITSNLAGRSAINGAYAATDANVAAAYGVAESAVASSAAFAAGSRGAQVKQITDAVQGVITSKSSVVFGFSSVYLEGERAFVRNEETNLGNLVADAQLFVAADALNLARGNYIVSIANGGGIRASIGTLSAPDAQGNVTKLPPVNGGAVSQLDVEDVVRFNNDLMVFDATPAQLKALLEHGVASLGSQGRFPQVGGVSFSYDPSAAAGSRVRDIALTGNGSPLQIYNDGVLASNAPATITVTTIGFLAQGGDSYPFKANGDNFRYVRIDSNEALSVSGATDEALNFTATGVRPTDALGQQKMFELYMERFHPTQATAFNQAETPAAQDTRIQNIAVRAEDVLAVTPSIVGTVDFAA